MFISLVVQKYITIKPKISNCQSNTYRSMGSYFQQQQQQQQQQKETAE